MCDIYDDYQTRVGCCDNEVHCNTIMKALFTIMKALFTIMKALFTIMKALFTIMKALFTIMKALFTIMKPKSSIYHRISVTASAVHHLGWVNAAVFSGLFALCLILPYHAYLISCHKTVNPTPKRKITNALFNYVIYFKNAFYRKKHHAPMFERFKWMDY